MAQAVTDDTRALIPLTRDNLDGAVVQTVDARILHEHLDVGRDFSNWIKGRIDEYGFVRGTDFVTVQGLISPDLARSNAPQIGAAKRGGARPRPTTEYHLSLDMAKELAMVERNEKGRQARRYFIECEKKLREADAVPAQRMPSQPYIKHIIRCVMQSVGMNMGIPHVSLREAAFRLGATEIDVVAAMEGEGWCFSRKQRDGGIDIIPRDQAITKGYLRTVVIPTHGPADDPLRWVSTVVILMPGLEELRPLVELMKAKPKRNRLLPPAETEQSS